MVQVTGGDNRQVSHSKGWMDGLEKEGCRQPAAYGLSTAHRTKHASYSSQRNDLLQAWWYTNTHTHIYIKYVRSFVC